MSDLHIDLDRLVRDGVLTRDEARALEHSQQSDSGGAARMEALSETVGIGLEVRNGQGWQGGEGGEDREGGDDDEGGKGGKGGEDSEDGEDKDAVKEAATRHERHWVRVTRVCNQRCTFCLDSMNQDGTTIDTDSLKAYIALGRRMGRQRLILSGGEASVHPDYIELIRYGKEVGYEWIQTVTNGMMFAYRSFARACATAGLDEATVSMHGHTARLHDRLTGTRGAFVTGIKGIRNLQRTGRVVVNIDVVINKQNYRYLPEIIDYYYDLGIREFDLLHVIPFGRGFDEHRASLYYDLNDAVPYLRRAFARADKPGVYLWTNRLPVPYLEDHERLIQDPHKLYYEFDGGRHNFEGFLKHGLKPDCWGERCDYCFLEGACRGTMFPYRELLEAGCFPVVRLAADHVFAGAGARARFLGQSPRRLWLRAANEKTAARALDALDVGRAVFAGAEVAVELGAGADPGPIAADERVAALIIADPADAPRYLVGSARPRGARVEVLLDRELAAWLLARPATVRARRDDLVLTLRNHEYLSGSRATDPDPATLARLAGLGARLKNVPRCVAGAPTLPADHDLLDAAMLDGAGDLDLDRYVHHFIENEYYAKSLRCHRCAEHDRCRGLHVNYLRNHGFAMLTPLDDAGRPLADAASFDRVAEALKRQHDGRNRREQRRLAGVHHPDHGRTAIALDAMKLSAARDLPEGAAGGSSPDRLAKKTENPRCP